MGRSMLLLPAIVIAIVGILTHQLGIFDRPEFVERRSVLDHGQDDNNNDGTTGGGVLYALMAPSTASSYGNHIRRLLQETHKVILESSSSSDDGRHDHATALAQMAKTYGAPVGTKSISVGLYFDNPSKVKFPRWAIGWAIEAPNFESVQLMAEQMNQQKDSITTELSEPIRAVRIGTPNQPVLMARIPWRNMFTPMIAPMLQWKRGFDTYQKGGYTSNPNYKGRQDDIEPPGVVALEIYVTDANDVGQYIDYIVLMGDTTNVWSDAFPLIENQQPPPLNQSSEEGGTVKQTTKDEDTIGDTHDVDDNDDEEEDDAVEDTHNNDAEETENDDEAHDDKEEEEDVGEKVTTQE